MESFLFSKFPSHIQKISKMGHQMMSKKTLAIPLQDSLENLDDLMGTNEKDAFIKFKEGLAETTGYASLSKATLSDEDYENKMKDPSTPHILKVAMKNYREWVFKLSNEEIKNICHYTNKGHYMVNDHLRGNPSSTKTIRDSIEGFGHVLHTSLSKGIIPEKIKVYHRNNQSILQELPYNKIDELIGQKLHIKNFLSTSLALGSCVKFPTHNLLMSIDVPKGANGAFIADISTYKNENEILFDRNQVLEIKKVNQIFDQLLMHCEMQEKKE
jgi:hypothetical protein